MSRSEARKGAGNVKSLEFDGALESQSGSEREQRQEFESVKLNEGRGKAGRSGGRFDDLVRITDRAAIRSHPKVRRPHPRKGVSDVLGLWSARRYLDGLSC